MSLLLLALDEEEILSSACADHQLNNFYKELDFEVEAAAWLNLKLSSVLVMPKTVVDVPEMMTAVSYSSYGGGAEGLEVNMQLLWTPYFLRVPVLKFV